MKIGIISDTHRKVKKTKKALAHLIQNGAEFIIHAGDIVEVEILQMLKNSSLDYIAVYGNNDHHLMEHHENFNLVQEPYYFNLAGLKFKLMHLPYYMAPDADVVVFGHTHHFQSEMNSGKLFLNSGEVCARKKPISEFAMLEVLDDKFVVTHYEKGDDEVVFSETLYKHSRVK
ncbi:MAG: YfcE family phosphodiesterase [Campylobacterota bacterium]|nr:YfcE family phosphodiesterase [Campylobacterota bacterium]